MGDSRDIEGGYFEEAAVAEVKDAADCSSLEPASDSAASCYLAMASEKKEMAFCQEILAHDSLRSACFKEVAAALQDDSVCDAMTLPESEDYQLGIEIGLCKEFVKTQSGMVKTADSDAPRFGGVSLEACRAMTDQEQMSTGQCYFKVAVGMKDYAVCNSIVGSINSQTRIMCYNEVAKALDDPSVCDKMDVPDYSYLDMAKEQCRKHALD